MLFSVGGMMLMPAAHDLLTMFVALEVLSLPLYLLWGWPGGGGSSPRKRR
jgi:NADH-quinone oxidoreductase subunit N